MFYHDQELQYPVEVEEPDLVFAKILQEAIGGLEVPSRSKADPKTHNEVRERGGEE